MVNHRQAIVGTGDDGVTLVSLGDAARMLGISRGTLFRLLDDGEISRVRIRRRTLVRYSDLLSLIERSAEVPPAD
jgi:excisionase family DNA binding protein